MMHKGQHMNTARANELRLQLEEAEAMAVALDNVAVAILLRRALLRLRSAEGQRLC